MNAIGRAAVHQDVVDAVVDEVLAHGIEPARLLSATSTFVPTPSVLRTSVGRRMPAGTRTIPPNAPTLPAESAVRVPATSAADPRLGLVRAREIDAGRRVLSGDVIRAPPPARRG